MFPTLRKFVRGMVGFLLLALALMASAVVAVVGVGPPLPLGLVLVSLTTLVGITSMKDVNDHGIPGWRRSVYGLLSLRPRLRHTAWPLLG